MEQAAAQQEAILREDTQGPGAAPHRHNAERVEHIDHRGCGTNSRKAFKLYRTEKTHQGPDAQGQSQIHAIVPGQTQLGDQFSFRHQQGQPAAEQSAVLTGRQAGWMFL